MPLFFLQGLTFGFSAAVAPGPFLAYILSRTLALGARRALPLALAPILSDGPIVTLVVIVLARMPSTLVHGLNIAGGAFLIALAWGAFRSASAITTVRATSALAEAPPAEAAPRGEPATGACRSLWHGALMNLLNPNPWLFWSIIGGPILVEGWTRSSPPSVAMPAAFLAGFYLALIGGMATFILLFAAAHRLDPRIVRALNFAAAVALLAFGLCQMGRGIFG